MFKKLKKFIIITAVIVAILELTAWARVRITYDMDLTGHDLLSVGNIDATTFTFSDDTTTNTAPVRSATLVVAASDSSAKSKSQADYVCDGTADDVEIQAAIDALPAGGGHVVLSEETFFISDYPLIFGKSSIWVSGQGSGTLIEDTTALPCLFRIYESTHIRLSSIKFHKVNKLPAGNMQAGVSVAQSSNCLIDNVHIEGTLLDGIGDATPLQGFIIDDGGFLPGAGSTGIVITNCYATKCQNEGFSIYGPNSKNNIISNSVAEDNGLYGFVIERHSENNIVSNNIVRNTIDVSPGNNYIFLVDASYNTVTNNVLYNTHVTTSNGIGIFLDGLSTNNLIQGNTIVDMPIHGIHLVHESIDNKIINNLIVKTKNTGIYVDAPKNEIRGNIIDMPTASGIRADVSDVLIKGNTIKYPISQHGIYSYSGSAALKNLDILDNTLIGCPSGIYLYAHTNNISNVNIKGNSIFDRSADITATLHENVSAGASQIKVTHTNGLCLGMKITIGSETKRIIALDNVVYTTSPITLKLDSTLTSPYDAETIITGKVQAVRGIYTSTANGGSLSNIYIERNDVRDVPTAMTLAGGETVKNNSGYTTENSGTATLVNGQTSIVVNHGLDVTPVAGDIMVTPIESLGAATEFYIDTYTATQFTIHVDVNPTQDVDFAWKAIVL